MTRNKRLERVARVNAKHPPYTHVDVESREEPGARAELVDLLLELLASASHSRR